MATICKLIANNKPANSYSSGIVTVPETSQLLESTGVYAQESGLAAILRTYIPLA